MCCMTEKTTRERIIEAADQLFYQQGYEQTSFADVAASRPNADMTMVAE